MELTPNFSGGRQPGMPSVRRIPLFTKKTVFSRKHHNLVIVGLNALMNAIVRRGEADAFFLSDDNAIYQYTSSAASSSTTPPQQSSARRYKVVVPALPLNTTQFNFDNYFCAKTWDGVNLGADEVYIAKQWHVQNARTTESYRNITKTFTYAYNSAEGFRDYTRTVHVTSPGNTYDDETQLLWPPILVGDEVWADDISSTANGTVITRPNPSPGQDPLPITLMDKTPRWWQTVPVDPPP